MSQIFLLMSSFQQLYRKFYVFYFTFNFFLIFFLRTEVEACPRACTCRWRGGKEMAECTGKGLARVPEGIGSGVQVLDISRNSLHSLSDNAFADAGLHNLQKLLIQECRLVRVDEAAFSELTNLVDLDLASNFLMDVPSEAISVCQALMRLSLNNNPIRRLEDRAFPGLPNLSILEMSQCNLSTISLRAFLGLTSLTHLKIDGNKLTTLAGSALTHMLLLQVIEIQGNLWNCDCHLRELQTWLANSSVTSVPTAFCTTPPRLKGMSIDVLPEEELACLPNITRPAVNASSVAYLGQNTKLQCVVNSVPPAEVRWMRHGRVITNNTIERGGQRFLVSEVGEDLKRSILTIKNTELESEGLYGCMAENRAGKVLANWSLQVSTSSPPSDSLSGGQIAWILLLILLVAASASAGAYYCVFHHSKRKDYEENKGIIVKETTSNNTKVAVKDIMQSTSNVSLKNEKTKLNDVASVKTPQFLPYQNIVNEYESALMDATIKNPPPDVVNVRQRTAVAAAAAAAAAAAKRSSLTGQTPSSSARSSLEMYCVQNTSNSDGESGRTDYKETDIDSEVVSERKHHHPSPLLEELSERLSQIPSSSYSNHNSVKSNSSDGVEVSNSAVMPNSASHPPPPPPARYSTLDTRKNRHSHQQSNHQDLLNNLRRTQSQERMLPRMNHVGPYTPATIQEEYPQHAFQNEYLHQNSINNQNPAAREGAQGSNKSALARMRSAVPVLPPLPLHRLLRTRESPDEGYADEGEEVCES